MDQQMSKLTTKRGQKKSVEAGDFDQHLCDMSRELIHRKVVDWFDFTTGAGQNFDQKLWDFMILPSGYD